MSHQQRTDLRKLLARGADATDIPPSIGRMRTDFATMMGTFPVPDDVRQTDIELGGLPAVRVTPDARARPGTILYFHGGSFTMGSPATAMVLTANLVRRTGMSAISVDYRLAPEHPFPAAIDDCLAAYRAVLDDGADPQQVVLAGDSAGGCLAVTTTLSARDAGLPLPAAVACFSPGLDQTRTGTSMTTKDGIDPFFTADGLAAGGQRYLAGADPHHALASPAVHADMRDFPPLLLQVGTDELLLDDSVRLAERAREAEVDIVLDITAGVPHVFQLFVDALDEAGRAFDRAALFLTQHTTG